MVDIVPYTPEMLPTLLSMLQSQKYLGMADINNETLPAIGFIANIDNVPTAAGFLRRVEGGFAQLDTLMSNAEQSSELRHDGISQCVDSLIEEAKKLKLHGILATSKDESTIMRAISIGFHVVEDQKLIALPLKEHSKHV